jgi:LmbE family N-acetylglucosaminyl deacetylase
MNIIKLIIVAHPDDETIWCSDILDKNTFVLVVCGKNKYSDTITEQRIKEFNNAMNIVGCKFKILDFIDKKTRWDEKLEKLITKYIIDTENGFPLLESIYTHNYYGEYGHQDHIRIHYIIKNIIIKNKFICKNVFMFWPDFGLINIPKNINESYKLSEGLLQKIINKEFDKVEPNNNKKLLLSQYIGQNVEIFKKIKTDFIIFILYN